MTDEALAILADAIAIQRVKAEYCRAADMAPADVSGALAVFATVFTDDVRCDYGVAQAEGMQAVSAWLTESIGGSARWMWHAIHTPNIRVTGDAADAAWTVLVRRQGHDEPAPAEIVGRYHDRFRRTPDGWKIGDIRLETIG